MSSSSLIGVVIGLLMMMFFIEATEIIFPSFSPAARVVMCLLVAWSILAMIYLSASKNRIGGIRKKSGNFQDTVFVSTTNGRLIKFDRDNFAPSRIHTDDGYGWTVESDGFVHKIDPDSLPIDPVEHDQQSYANGEIDEAELERRLDYDLELAEYE